MSTNKVTYLNPTKEPFYKKAAIIVSVILPLAVAALFGIKIDGYDLHFLPAIYAGLNGLTAFLLVFALYAIKQKNIKLHKALINSAIVCSVLFLFMYVAYHITSDTTVYLGKGISKYVYYFVLISHILLSIIITPFVCFTYLKGWLGDVKKHKKLTKITYPLWLYVAVSGVVVYLMISPYYN